MREPIIYRHNGPDGTQDYIIQLTFEYTEEGDRWVGVCLELQTTAYADSLVDVLQELRDAVGLQLDEAERLGFVWDFLNDNNVPARDAQPVATPGFSLVS